MSTRGVIARAKGDGFEGRYHHWDSYPKGLGAALWHLCQDDFKGDWDEMLRTLIDEHPAGWSTVVGKTFALPAGFNNSDKGNCLSCGREMWEHYYQYYEQHDRAIPPEGRVRMENGNYAALDHIYNQPRYINAECYCHGDRKEDEQVVTEQNAASIGCEYAYVFNARRQMVVLSSYNDDGSKMIGMFGCGNPDSRWQVMAVVDLDGTEPDWEHL